MPKDLPAHVNISKGTFWAAEWQGIHQGEIYSLGFQRLGEEKSGEIDKTQAQLWKLCSGQEWYITGECQKQIHHSTLFCLRASGSLQKTPLDVTVPLIHVFVLLLIRILSLSCIMQKSHLIVDKWTTEHFPTRGLSFPTLNRLWSCSKLFCDSFISRLQHGVT